MFVIISRDKYNNFLKICDVSEKLSFQDLSNIHKNLFYLCPFSVEIEKDEIFLRNYEDLFIFLKNHNLVFNFETNLKDGKHILFSPILFDLEKNIPVFPVERIEYKISKNENKVFIISPCIDPVLRGKIIEECLSLGYDGNFITMGGVYEKNKDRLCTLSLRFLLKCGVEYKKIVKTSSSSPDDILMLIEILNLKGMDIIVGCDSELIYRISRGVRMWSKRNGYTLNVRYVCP